MTARNVPPERDPGRPAPGVDVTITVDGRAISAIDGQTIAGALLADGRLAWRTSTRGGRPRGVFCGIGVCFDCLVTVNEVADVRACQRRARDGDVIRSQDHRTGEPG